MELRSLLAIRSVWVSNRLFSSVALSPVTAGAGGVWAVELEDVLAGRWGPGLGTIDPGFGLGVGPGPGRGTLLAGANVDDVTSREALKRSRAAIWSSDRAFWGVLPDPLWRGLPIPWWEATCSAMSRQALSASSPG